MNDFDEAFAPLPEETKAGIKQQLFVSIINESNEAIRRKFADVAAQLVSDLFGMLVY